MKPFNLEEYIANPEKKVVTREGIKVEIINTNGREPFRIIGYINGNQSPSYWCSNGHFMTDGKTAHSFDLFFVDEESGDERTRKEIRNFLIDMECKKEWITYLERQKEQKPAEWSDVDKTTIDCAVEFIEKAGLPSLAASLKSIHSRSKASNNWKPSKNQMNKLFSIIAALRKNEYDDIADFLASLYGQLKKLMEE